MKKLFLLGLVSVSFISCKKEGCTDSNATNYNSEAKKDDASCQYSEKVIIWQDKQGADSWLGFATTLKFYVNGNYQGSCSAFEYSTSEPSCSDRGQFDMEIDLGKNKTGTVNVKVKDDSDYTWYDENVSISAGNCSKKKMN